MNTIVICIDRDNDLGEKAGIETPIIGRNENLNAAVKLALLDPEDSDTNTIFGGLKILDELNKMKVNSEIVSFAGDKNVGIKSDKKIANQLDIFFEENKFDSAIFVSDGAEDESLIPIVQSRIKIDFVKRVVVIQSEKLERTYYIIKSIFKNPKVVQKYFMPLGITLISYSISIIFGYSRIGIIGILFIIGLYMLLKSLNIERYTNKIRLDINKNTIRNILKSALFSKITITLMCSFLFSLYGIYYGWRTIINLNEVYLYWNLNEDTKIIVSYFTQESLLFFCYVFTFLSLMINKKISTKTKINSNLRLLLIIIVYLGSISYIRYFNSISIINGYYNIYDDLIPLIIGLFLYL